ncbi:hypothetical protein BD626DRAFT_488947 [Schizophyllum amplum]|uniref:Uncharacterized protein n=1 Tax=Schizophyllum amplum TaxID=97359 RepID=A0A550CL14_9AGAR|nr:hypothetical protein BD626DRAFT_488947 [Auriculariopsis ampla]
MWKSWPHPPEPEDYREVKTMQVPLTLGHMLPVKGLVAKVVRDGFVMTAADDTDIFFLYATAPWDRRVLADSTVEVYVVGVACSETVVQILVLYDCTRARRFCTGRAVRGLAAERTAKH